LIEFLPPVGVTYRYRMKVRVSTAMRNATLSETTSALTMKAVKRVGGVTTLEIRSGSAVGKGLFAEAVKGQEARKPQTVQVQIDRHFRSLTRPGGSPGGFSGLFIPARPIAVGDTWNQTINLSQMGGMASVGGLLPVTYRFAEVVNGRRAMIEMSADATTGVVQRGQRTRIRLRIHSVTTIDLRTGMLNDVRSSNSIGLPGQPFSEQITQVVTRT
jgi:hypothetical protein